MTPERTTLWGIYFHELSSRMELKGWHYNMMGAACEDHAGAQFSGLEGKDEACIALNSNWEKYPPEKQRQFATHELMHSHLHQADMYIYALLNDLCVPAEAKRHYKTFDVMTEYAVERLAWALCPNLPLPAEVVPALGPKPPKEAKPTKKRKKAKKSAHLA